MVRRIFISSVQRELSAERKAIVDLVSGNPQLARFFSTFAFEFDVPAADKRTDEVYLAELAVSDLYVGIIGNEYGGVTPDGVSATESEYDEATRLGIPRFLFVKGSSDKVRDPRERNFLHKVSPGLIRVRFESTHGPREARIPIPCGCACRKGADTSQDGDGRRAQPCGDALLRTQCASLRDIARGEVRSLVWQGTT